MLWKKDETRKLETVVKFKLTMQFGGPAVGQKDPQHFCSTRTQVCSPAQHRGLKDPVLLQLWHRSQLWLRCGPRPKNPTCHRVHKKEKKKKKDHHIVKKRKYEFGERKTLHFFTSFSKILAAVHWGQGRFADHAGTLSSDLTFALILNHLRSLEGSLWDEMPNAHSWFIQEGRFQVLFLTIKFWS